ncbi:MAG: hypothetical protein AAF587_33125 [Bacteroidota bacterium]
MRTYIFMLLCFLMLSATAQDRLSLTDGQEIQVWITEVGDNYVKYIHANKDEGTEYNLPKRMIVKLIYASGEETIFSQLAEHPNPDPSIKDSEHPAGSEVKITSVTPQSSPTPHTDTIELMNGGSIEANVAEINDRYIEYIVGENSHQIPVTEVTGIAFADGSYERLYEKDEVAELESARKASQDYRKKRQEIQEQQVEPEESVVSVEPKRSSTPFSLRIKRFRTQSDKDQVERSVAVRLEGGLNLIMGIGPGRRDLDWALQLSLADVPSPNKNAQSTGSWKTTAGIHLGLMAAYTINPHINLISGLQVSQKGYITHQMISFEEGESVQKWMINIREREQMVHLDIPLGIEARILPMLECQVGLLGSVVLRGSTFLTTDTDIFGAADDLIDYWTDSERRVYQGVAFTAGGFMGVRIPVNSQIGLHLRMLVNTGGGYEGAFANTVIQLGAGYRL